MKTALVLLSALVLTACSNNAPEIDTAALKADVKAEVKAEIKAELVLEFGLDEFGKAFDKGKYGRAGAELSSLGNGCTTYKVKYRGWPKAIEELGQMTDSDFNRNDPWGRPYSIRTLSDALEIRSTGKDGVAMNDDDIFWTSDKGVHNPRD